MNKYFQRRYTDGQKAHEKCSTSLVIREMEMITTKMRHYFQATRIDKIRKTIVRIGWQGYGGTGTFMHCWNQNDVVTLKENSLEVTKKKSMKLPYDPVIPLLCIYPREMRA